MANTTARVGGVQARAPLPLKLLRPALAIIATLDEHGGEFQSLRTLAAALGESKETARRHAVALEALGVIAIERAADCKRELPDDVEPADVFRCEFDPLTRCLRLGHHLATSSNSLPLCLSMKDAREGHLLVVAQSQTPIAVGLSPMCWPITEMRWTSHAHGVYGWAVASVLRHQLQPMGVRELARLVSRFLGRKVTAQTVLDRLDKMERGSDGVKAVQHDDGRWMVYTEALEIDARAEAQAALHRAERLVRRATNVEWGTARRASRRGDSRRIELILGELVAEREEAACAEEERIAAEEAAASEVERIESEHRTDESRTNLGLRRFDDS